MSLSENNRNLGSSVYYVAEGQRIDHYSGGTTMTYPKFTKYFANREDAEKFVREKNYGKKSIYDETPWLEVRKIEIDIDDEPMTARL